MSSTNLTRDWLQTVLRPYPSRDKIIPEVLDILSNRRTLSVKTDAFTFDSGHTALLLLLHGTLPITYRGATYHIPIHIWVPLEYPRSAPLAFVVPTKEMGVRKGREVEPGGRVREEIVDEWWRGWESKSIETLLKQLSSIFSVTPPVYAKPSEQRTNNTSQSDQLRSPNGTGSSPIAAHPPQPPARPMAIQESLPQYRSAPTPPPNPYPPQLQTPQRQASGSYPTQQRQQISQSPPLQAQSPPIPHRPGQIPPIPQRQSSPPQPQPISPQGPGIPNRPYIATAQAVYPQNPSSPIRGGPSSPYRESYTQGGPGSPMRSNSGYVQGGNYAPPQQPVENGYPALQYPQQQPTIQQQQYQPQQQQQQQQHQYQPQGGLSQAYSPQAAPKIPPHPVQQPQLDYRAPSQQTAQAAQPPSIAPKPTQRQPLPDLLSSPEQTTSPLPSDPGAPPPIPPSKPPPPSLLHLHAILLPHLNASLPPLLHNLQANRAHLLERKEDLESGEPAIRDEMARLEAVKSVCDGVGRRMEDVVRRGEERVADLENRGEISVDEVVCGISIVHNQLIDLVAEDNAIEDTIYHITRALDTERIDLDRFLKSIRVLAREQYMKRALIERILQGMGQTQGW